MTTKKRLAKKQRKSKKNKFFANWQMQIDRDYKMLIACADEYNLKHL